MLRYSVLNHIEFKTVFVKDIYIQAKRVDNQMMRSIFHESPEVQKVLTKYRYKLDLWDKGSTIQTWCTRLQGPY